MTNYEHIKIMSLDDMAGFIIDTMDCYGMIKAQIVCEDYGLFCAEKCKRNKKCIRDDLDIDKNAVLHWLSKEVK